MITRKQLITRTLALTALLCLAPVAFGGSAADGVGTDLVRASEACAAGDECCYEPFSFCGERPNMAACNR